MSTSARCAPDIDRSDRDTLRRRAAARPRTAKPARPADAAPRRARDRRTAHHLRRARRPRPRRSTGSQSRPGAEGGSGCGRFAHHGPRILMCGAAPAARRQSGPHTRAHTRAEPTPRMPRPSLSFSMHAFTSFGCGRFAHHGPRILMCGATPAARRQSGPHTRAHTRAAPAPRMSRPSLSFSMHAFFVDPHSAPGPVGREPRKSVLPGAGVTGTCQMWARLGGYSPDNSWLRQPCWYALAAAAGGHVARVDMLVITDKKLIVNVLIVSVLLAIVFNLALCINAQGCIEVVGMRKPTALGGGPSLFAWPPLGLPLSSGRLPSCCVRGG